MAGSCSFSPVICWSSGYVNCQKINRLGPEGPRPRVSVVDWLREKPAIDVTRKLMAGDNWTTEHDKEAIVEGATDRADS